MKPDLALGGRQILVVQDDSDTREILRFVSEENDASVVATDAVDKRLWNFKRFNPTQLSPILASRNTTASP
jgi:hypothetical protein